MLDTVEVWETVGKEGKGNRVYYVKMTFLDSCHYEVWPNNFNFHTLTKIEARAIIISRSVIFTVKVQESLNHVNARTSMQLRLTKCCSSLRRPSLGS